MEKLPKKFKERWIAALRSGEYKQGKHELQNGRGEYCCLGVACKANGLEVVYDSLPSPIGDGGFGTTPEQEKLIILNDLRGKSFSEIADWIEENL